MSKRKADVALAPLNDNAPTTVRALLTLATQQRTRVARRAHVRTDAPPWRVAARRADADVLPRAALLRVPGTQRCVRCDRQWPLRRRVCGAGTLVQY